VIYRTQRVGQQESQLMSKVLKRDLVSRKKMYRTDSVFLDQFGLLEQ
jgi:hypothetical protein